MTAPCAGQMVLLAEQVPVAQTPEAQFCAAPQAWPQEPQLALSLERSMGAPPEVHRVVPTLVQTPAVHCCCAPQLLAQAPQFAWSTAMSTQ